MRNLPIASDGWRFILPLLIAGIALIFIRQNWSIVLGAVVLLLAGFCVYFFRDFDRDAPLDDALLLSPGDGRILEVSKIEQGDHPGDQLVRIFLSVFDVHVQRAPVAGNVERILYKKGRFLDARDPSAHIENEQNTVVIHSPRGRVVVSQIAGLIARRIVCWAKEGDSIGQGERFGLIRFGSQVDLIVPSHVQVRVQAGDRVVGGETIIGHWTKK